MTVSVITDSSACIPAELRQACSIEVVPIQVMIDGTSRRATDVDRDELLGALDQGRDVSTSGPTPGDFLDAIEATDDGDGVVLVTLASTMSSTHQSATLAAGQAVGEVQVVDSGTAVGGHALIAIAAARAAQDGADLQSVVSVAKDVAGRVRLVATVGSLEALARSGRVPGIAQRTGDALGVRPLFEFRQGEVHVLLPSLAEDRAVGRLVSRCLDQHEEGHRLRASILHAGRRDTAERVLERLKSETEPAEAFISEFDAAMIVHSGTDVVGLAWWWEPATG